MIKIQCIILKYRFFAQTPYKYYLSLLPIGLHYSAVQDSIHQDDALRNVGITKSDRKGNGQGLRTRKGKG
ncbi:hypothetical protein NL54_18365 [Pantoea stewartii]|nr:hypothetical protein NL54_18365 [Pantoea stewartii]